jgi:DNA-binding XRE family transcriptional regulator
VDVTALQAEWGATIRALRKERGISPMALAAALGVHIATLYKIEAGQHQVSDEARIVFAHEFGVRVEDVFVYPAPATLIGSAPARAS